LVNLTDAILGSLPPSVCSGIAAWDEFTPGSKLVFGRNWDIDRAGMLKYMQYLSVGVFNPSEGNAFANVHPLGNVFLETGINERDRSSNSTSARIPIRVSIRIGKIPAPCSSRLNRCDTFDEAVAALSETPADMCYILQRADAARCVSVERPNIRLPRAGGRPARFAWCL